MKEPAAPLSREAFIRKYGNGGKCPMQFNTLSIEDAETEREQVLINNINWLFDVLTMHLQPPQD